MKHKKIITSVVFLLLGLGGLYAQKAVATTGGDGSGTGGTASYTVGQVVYTTNTGTNGSIAQGVQDAYEIFTVIKETKWRISLTIFPNPAPDHLTLQIKDYNKEKLMYQLFNIQGNQLSNGQIVARQTQINMKSLPTGTYFIHVVNRKNKKFQSFKIIKNR